VDMRTSAGDPRHIPRKTEGCKRVRDQWRPASGTARDQRYIRRTSQEPGVLWGTHARGRTSHQRVYARGACAQASRTTGCTLGTSEHRGIRGQLSAAGQTYQEFAFSGIKGGRVFWVLQSKHSEHPYEGNCTARHRARTNSGTSYACRALQVYADLRGIHTG
jgi:hypothetical protein